MRRILVCIFVIAGMAHSASVPTSRGDGDDAGDRKRNSQATKLCQEMPNIDENSGVKAACIEDVKKMLLDGATKHVIEAVIKRFNNSISVDELKRVAGALTALKWTEDNLLILINNMDFDYNVGARLSREEVVQKIGSFEDKAWWSDLLTFLKEREIGLIHHVVPYITFHTEYKDVLASYIDWARTANGSCSNQPAPITRLFSYLYKKSREVKDIKELQEVYKSYCSYEKKKRPVRESFWELEKLDFLFSDEQIRNAPIADIAIFLSTGYPLVHHLVYEREVLKGLGWELMPLFDEIVKEHKDLRTPMLEALSVGMDMKMKKVAFDTLVTKLSFMANWKSDVFKFISRMGRPGDYCPSYRPPVRVKEPETSAQPPKQTTPPSPPKDAKNEDANNKNSITHFTTVFNILKINASIYKAFGPCTEITVVQCLEACGQDKTVEILKLAEHHGLTSEKLYDINEYFRSRSASAKKPGETTPTGTQPPAKQEPACYFAEMKKEIEELSSKKTNRN